MKFIRIGGLSPVKQKGNYGKHGFHNAPARKGIYAMIWPYYELFLVLFNARNRKEYMHNGPRVFDHKGFVWCHFDAAVKYSAVERNGWYKVHTDHLPSILKKVIVQDACLMKEDTNWSLKDIPTFNPYHFVSKDHLEVFIERVSN